MDYILVGLNHKTAPVEIREKIALDRQGCHQALTHLMKLSTIDEATVISTCNRVEFYSSSRSPDKAQEELLQFILKSFDAPEHTDIQNHFYFKQGHDVISHLFQVTSSLDSQVTGENQITGQVKEAYSVAQEKLATGYYLNNLFDRALYVAKRVRTETEISKGNVSMGSIAVMLAKKIFGSLQDKTVLLLGAGKMGELAVRYLNSQSVKETLIINRSFEKAQALQALGLGTAHPFEDLPQFMQVADILITSISADIAELSHDELQKLMQLRHNQPLFVIDLGVPRNVQDDVSKIDNLYLYNVDDLQGIASESQIQRSVSIDQAQNIIDQEVRQFYEKHINSDSLPAIAQLGKKFEQIRQNEVQKTIAKMPHLTTEDQARIEKLTQSIINKVLHQPILSLRNEREMSEPGRIDFFKKLFRLDDEGE